VNPHPHNPPELAPLLLALGRAGIELARHPTDAARLRHRPADLPPDLSARLRLHRGAVLGLLVGGACPADDDAGYALGERLGVADELGVATHPGSAAWLVAVGESMGSSCELTTDGVYSGYGKVDRHNPGGGGGERPDPLPDREGIRRECRATLAAGDGRTGDDGRYPGTAGGTPWAADRRGAQGQAEGKVTYGKHRT